MSWHPQCYNNMYNRTVKGSPAKFKTRCQAAGKCLRGGFISIGDYYYHLPSSSIPSALGVALQKKMEKTQSYNDDGSTANEKEDLGVGGVGFDIDENGCMVELKRKDVYPLASEVPQDPAVTSAMTIPSVIPALPIDPANITQITVSVINSVVPTLEKRVDTKVNGELVRFETKVTNEINRQSSANKQALKLELTAAVNEKIRDSVQLLVKPQEMSEKIAQVVLDKIASVTSTRIEIQDLKGSIKDIGLQHKQFPILLKAVMARVNVWMAGPSGSGKTTAAQNVATALNLPFRYTGAVGDPYALVGYNDANGKYVRTPFREAWEFGGIFLWDEVDSSDPNALLAFNAALANGTAPFPDGCIPKHKDCILIAAANTWGQGADHNYVGRLKMDAAFLKRFAFLSWQYDEQLELQTAPNLAWTKRVQAVRKKVTDKGVRVLVTPRESYIGAVLLASGIPQSMVEEMTIFSSMTAEQRKSLAV